MDLLFFQEFSKLLETEFPIDLHSGCTLALLHTELARDDGEGGDLLVIIEGGVDVAHMAVDDEAHVLGGSKLRGSHALGVGHIGQSRALDGNEGTQGLAIGAEEGQHTGDVGVVGESQLQPLQMDRATAAETDQSIAAAQQTERSLPVVRVTDVGPAHHQLRVVREAQFDALQRQSQRGAGLVLERAQSAEAGLKRVSMKRQ